jgi:hypothetical protein
MPTNIVSEVGQSILLRNLYVVSREYTEIQKLLLFKNNTISNLIQTARESLRDSGSKAKLNAITYGALDGNQNVGRGSEGVSIQLLANSVDGINLITYVNNPSETFS